MIILLRGEHRIHGYLPEHNRTFCGEYNVNGERYEGEVLAITCANCLRTIRAKEMTWEEKLND